MLRGRFWKGSLFVFLSFLFLFFSALLNGSGTEKVCSLCHNEKLISHDLSFSHALIVCVLRTKKVS